VIAKSCIGPGRLSPLISQRPGEHLYEKATLGGGGEGEDSYRYPSGSPNPSMIKGLSDSGLGQGDPWRAKLYR